MPERPIEATEMRSRMVGGLRAEHVGERVRLTGWVHRRRDLGGLVFVDLRDRSGLVQVSFGPDWTDADSMALAPRLGHEDVVAVEGLVEARPEGARKEDADTGEVEVRVERVERLSAAVPPAIPVYVGPDDELPSEELRLRHRVLDLRRAGLQDVLALRHRLTLAARNYFDSLGFLDIETPVLTKPTPEGARDYLVPSRNHRGEFYALPQSPQIYKQILMVAGFDRYFQVARCFRDEDLRADRQPEFTQLDVEASFVEPDDILRWTEGLMVALAGVAGIPVEPPFPRLTWAEAMERFGSDRPDLRYGLEIADWTEPTADLDFGIVRSGVDAGGRLRGIAVPGGARLSRRLIEQVEAAAKGAGAPGMLWAKVTEEGASGPLGKFMAEHHPAALGLAAGDLAVACVGADAMTSPALSAARAALFEVLELAPERQHAWLWVTDFPVFDETAGGGLTPSHHPFVMPDPRDAHLLDSEPLRVRGLAYDLVFDGAELGGGSIRIHEPALQRKILGLLGLSDAEIELKFGFLLEALAAGAPPHGGIALGLDRIVRRFAGVDSLRDVIAFPKTTAARALYEGAPSAVGDGELAELGLRLDRTPGTTQ